MSLTQKQVISRTDCKVGTSSADDYETNPMVKLTWSPVGEQSPVRETPVKEKTVMQSDSISPMPSGISPGPDLKTVGSPTKSDSLPSYVSSPKSGEVTSDPPVVPTPASGSQDVAPPPSEVTLPMLATPPSAQPSKKSRGPSQAPVTKFYPQPDGASPTHKLNRLRTQ